MTFAFKISNWLILHTYKIRCQSVYGNGQTIHIKSSNASQITKIKKKEIRFVFPKIIYFRGGQKE